MFTHLHIIIGCTQVACRVFFIVVRPLCRPFLSIAGCHLKAVNQGESTICAQRNEPNESDNNGKSVHNQTIWLKLLECIADKKKPCTQYIYNTKQSQSRHIWSIREGTNEREHFVVLL